MLEPLYSYGVGIINPHDDNTMSRDLILSLPLFAPFLHPLSPPPFSTPFLHPLSSPPSFAPFVAMTYRAARYKSTALRTLLPCNASLVYINSSIVLSIESIVYSHTKLLQLQTDSPRAPIAVPTLISSWTTKKPQISKEHPTGGVSLAC